VKRTTHDIIGFFNHQDGGTPKLQSTTIVVIDVTDISDMPPKFEQSIYIKEIDENTPVVRKLLIFHCLRLYRYSLMKHFSCSIYWQNNSSYI
jgi:hypothetical protein